MEFFHLIKATQKSGKPDAIFWQSQKTEARASLALDVALEDAEIETGRGHDYLKPVRTDFPVYNDLPEEGTVDYTWCERYSLQADGRTWLPKAGDVSTGAVDNTAAQETTVKVVTTVESVPLENRNPAVRYAVHLTCDKYQSHITKEQQLAASEMSLDEGNTYLQNLLLAKNDIPEVAELSLNTEWKMIQAVKEIFAPNEEHEVKLLAAFMADWLRVDAGDRNEVVREWRNGKLTLLLKSERTSDDGVETGQDIAADDGIQIDENDDETTRYPVVRMPFRKQLLAQFTSDELRHHVTREEYEAISALEMDTDNSYVQNLLLAAENCEEVKGYDTKDLWRYTDAIRKVFSQEKRHELALVLRFTRIWAATDYIDRGILAREWAAGNRVSNVQRTDAGTNADGGYVTDRGEGAHHTLDTLDLEIACALLPMDFHHFEIPSSVLHRAKEIVATKEEPWKSWSKILRNQPGVLAVNRAAIFNLVRIAPENIHLTPVAHLEFVNQTMTAEFNAATELMPLPIEQPEAETQTTEEHQLPKWAEAGEQQLADGSEAKTQTLPKWANAAASKPQVANLGGGVFSIDGLMNEKQPKNDDRSSLKEGSTSHVQMEETGSNETKNSASLSEGTEEIIASTGPSEADCSAVTVSAQSDLNKDDSAEMLYTHLMVDVEAFGKKPGSPLVSIGAVFFDPTTGNTGPEFYEVISLESSMACGGVPDASTIIFWLKASSEARAEIVMDDAITMSDALQQLDDFITKNASNGKDSVQVWGNGATYDNVLLAESFDRAGIPCPWKYWNNRDVRTIVELGKAVGYTPRYEIPFVGEPHKAISDAHHQVKYVSAIWQRLTSN